MSHRWLLCRAPLPSSFLSSTKIESASLLKHLCTELLQHFWRKKIVLPNSMSLLFSAQQLTYFFLIFYPIWIFVWALFKISFPFMTHPPFSYTSTLFSSSGYSVYLGSWSQPELLAWHFCHLTLCLILLFRLVSQSVCLPCLGQFQLQTTILD